MVLFLSFCEQLSVLKSFEMCETEKGNLQAVDYNVASANGSSCILTMKFQMFYKHYKGKMLYLIDMPIVIK